MGHRLTRPPELWDLSVACPWSLRWPGAPLRHRYMDLHFEQAFGASTRARVARPGAPHVPALSAAVLSLELLLHPRTALRIHLGRLPLHQRCSGSEAVPDAVKIRVCPHQRWQVPGVLIPFLWGSAVHESGNFFSKCWRKRWKVNFECVGSCVKHGLRSRKGVQDQIENRKES